MDNVEKTKNAVEVNVCAYHPFSQTIEMEIDVEALVISLDVALTQNALLLIHLNVCVRLDTQAIP